MPEPVDLSYIAEELRPLARPVGRYDRHPENPKSHDFAAMRESFDDHGQLKPIVAASQWLAEDGTVLAVLARPVIVAGNGWHELFERAEIPLIAAVEVPMTEDKARRFLVMDNQSQQRGGMNEEALVELLVDLQRTERGLAGTGYTDDLVQNMLDRMSGAHSGEFPTVDPDDLETTYECPRCHYTWSGKPSSKIKVTSATAEPNVRPGDLPPPPQRGEA